MVSYGLYKVWCGGKVHHQSILLALPELVYLQRIRDLVIIALYKSTLYLTLPYLEHIVRCGCHVLKVLPNVDGRLQR